MLHNYIISLSIRYQRSVSGSKTNPLMWKALTLLISTQEHTIMSRIPGQSEASRAEDGVYCLGCRGSMKSLLGEGH